MLVAAWGRADDEVELHAAQEKLRLARAHLLAAPPHYQGLRRLALQQVTRALRELNMALGSARQEEQERKQGGQRSAPEG